MDHKETLKNTSLSKETLEKIKKDLLARKRQIIKDLSEFSEKIDNAEDFKTRFPEYGNKKDENAQEIDEYSTNLATEKVLEKTLRDINNALKRIENGTYGICKYCGEPINEKRLLARPVASACVKCKIRLQNS